jgi:UDP-2,3-diacylglucosamine pyrophosphatase LpxH
MLFQQIYVVSDLHFGGSTRKIFAGNAEFPLFLKQITTEAQTRSTALVINGDFIDFLAIDMPSAPRYFDPDFAIDKLKATIADAEFNASFVALGEFANAALAYLIINLGYHDLELCLPEVQRAFAESISVDFRRIIWVDDGSGVRLRVADCDVLCLHGNEVDDNNDVDFDMLRYIKLSRHAGVYRQRKLDQWIPNAGTQLVIDGMNAIKVKHAFVDLLKPETSAVPPILLSIDAKLARASLKPISAALVQGRARTWLSKNFEPGRLTLGPDPIEQIVDREHPQTPLIALSAEELAQQLAAIENAFASGHKPLDLLPDGQETLGGLLDWAKFGLAKLRGKSAAEQLRNALSDLMKDKSFELETAETMNFDLQAKVTDKVHFLCSGHTHFRRSLKTGPASHHYNSGTWAYLMRLDESLLGDSANFAQFHTVLAQGAELRTLVDQGYAFKQLTAIHIAELGAHQVRGRLLEYTLVDGKLSATLVDKSERVIAP